MKPIICLLAAVALIANVEAANEPKKLSKAQQEQKAKMQAHEKKRMAVKALLDAKDTNHDGSLSKDEYVARETDPAAAAKRFDQFNKNGNGNLERDEIAHSLGK